MFSLNRTQLIGYITQPVELRQTPGGQSVADLNIAVPYTFTAEGGKEMTGVSYHNVTAWAGMADTAAQYLKPSAQVYIAGRLQTDSWEDQNTNDKRSRTQLVAMDLIMLDPRDGQIGADASATELTKCLNRNDIIGNLTRDPEVRTTTTGQSVVSMGVATNERWKDKSSGEMKERTEFHNVVVWGELAQTCAQHLKKGMRVYATGRVQTRSWETQSGSKRTTTETVADTISMLGVKNDSINYSSQTRAERKGNPGGTSVPSKKPELQPVGVSASNPKPSGNFDVPEVKYESEVKVEDLPF